MSSIRGLNVVGGEPCGEVAAVVSNGQVAAAAYSSDGPAVSVLDPVVGREAESAVLVRVMITSPTLAWFPSAKSTSRPAG